jgi:tRNA threonylcarbamoyladenosine biosynthesis protein TsaE
MKIITKSTQETKKWANKYAQSLQGGEIIGLIGDLGAGKTTFSQGLATGLMVKQNVNSPTYVIMKIYQINNSKSKIKNLVHIDAYRLESSADLEAIGALEYFGREDTVVLIEWANKIKGVLPRETIFINIKGEQDNRTFVIKND